tara:strand:+ start:308 stop:751 length:444 start_codon:yes stop_codon:yes gene_type:complete
MVDDQIELYVIGRARDIAPGTAKSYSLARLDKEGNGRPLPLLVVRTENDVYYGYANICPHNQIWLNIGDGAFFSEDGCHLQCGRHGAKFEIDSGLCIEGPCEKESLEAIPLLVDDGDLCVYGVVLAEADPFSDYEDDETMEIMIHPD